MGINDFGVPVHDSQIKNIDKSLDNHLICDSGSGIGIGVFEHGQVIFKGKEGNFEAIVVIEEICIFFIKLKLIVHKMADIIVLSNVAA